MTPRVQRAGPGRWLANILLLIAGVYLAVRCWGAVETVLSPIPPVETASAGSGSALVEKARGLDAELASVQPPERNPLSRKVIRSTWRPPDPTPAPTQPPSLRMILYDTVSPVVQLSVNGQLSDRLHVGDTFLGWNVESITADRTVVSKDGESFSLSLRRAQ
jgi:hypothetical protein